MFADTAGVVASRSVAFMLGQAGDEELLVRLLEEVIYLVEVAGVVPVDVRVQLTPDGGLHGRLGVAPLEAAIVIGPAPKAVAWHELSFAPRGPAGGAGSRWTFEADVADQPLMTPTGRSRAMGRASPACSQVATTSSTSL